MDKDERSQDPAAVAHVPGLEPRASDGTLPVHSDFLSVWPDSVAGHSTQPVRVLLVDDVGPMNGVIAQELQTDQRIHLVGQARGLRDGLRKLSVINVDVVMVELKLEDGSGFDLIEKIKSRFPIVEVVALCSCEDDAHALRAFELGATGFLVRHAWVGHFAQAVLQVVHGGASITPQLTRRLLRRLDGRQGGSLPERARSDQLSVREREILGLVARGYTSAEIGSRLVISVQTVNAHIRNLYKSLRVHTRAQAVCVASERGLL